MEEKQNVTFAINWMGYGGSELVHSWEMATKYTFMESLKNLCGAAEQIFQPESSTLSSRFQLKKTIL